MIIILIILRITKKLSNEVADIFTSAIQFVLDRYNTQEMCVKGADTCSFVFDSVPDQYKTLEMNDKGAFKDPFMLQYCLDKYKTQETCDKALDTFLTTLEFVKND